MNLYSFLVRYTMEEEVCISADSEDEARELAVDDCSIPCCGSLIDWEVELLSADEVVVEEETNEDDVEESE